jgi:BASS family bile acid:Na+ symporter
MQANFFTNILLPVALGVLMLGMGLGLILADFQRITRYRKFGLKPRRFTTAFLDL